MTRMFGPRAAIAALILSLAGCGPGDGYRLARVRGTVTFHGQPARAGFVVFLPDDSRQTIGPQAMSTIASDGTYILSTKVSNDGAVVGYHKVGIMVYDPDPLVEVAEEDLTPDGIMTTKAQSARRPTTTKATDGPTFTDRGGTIYRVISDEDLRSPETSNLTVEVRRGSNSLNFHLRENGTIDIEP